MVSVFFSFDKTAMVSFFVSHSFPLICSSMRCVSCSSSCYSYVSIPYVPSHYYVHTSSHSYYADSCCSYSYYLLHYSPSFLLAFNHYVHDVDYVVQHSSQQSPLSFDSVVHSIHLPSSYHPDSPHNAQSNSFHDND
eukprot:373015_1